MLEIGYWLSSELHGPNKLVRDAVQAEDVGFEYAMISDHYHPWLNDQGHSPFVWNVIGGIAATTQRLRLGTGVTCPILRIHPAIIAQAAATSAAMMPQRFFLGVGSGENLNEHILGDKWPPAVVRLEMLEEAVQVMRDLWTGKLTSHRGKHYTVENARIYDLPDVQIPLMVAVSGQRSTELASRIGDGIITSSLSPDSVSQFKRSVGESKPCFGRFEVCWAEDEQKARQMAYRWWRTAAIKGSSKNELPIVAHFEQLASLVTEDDVAEAIICGPDPEPHIERLKQFAEAGYTHVSIHQVTPDQEGFFRLYERDVLPELDRMGLVSTADRALADERTSYAKL